MLANRGLHFHEGTPDTDATEVDRAVHRQGYSGVLNPNPNPNPNSNPIPNPDPQA